MSSGYPMKATSSYSCFRLQRQDAQLAASGSATLRQGIAPFVLFSFSAIAVVIRGRYRDGPKQTMLTRT